MDNNQGRYFGGPPSNLQYSLPPGARGRDSGGSDQVGPNDALFRPTSKPNDNDADRDLMHLPRYYITTH